MYFPPTWTTFFSSTACRSYCWERWPPRPAAGQQHFAVAVAGGIRVSAWSERMAGFAGAEPGGFAGVSEPATGGAGVVVPATGRIRSAGRLRTGCPVRLGRVAGAGGIGHAGGALSGSASGFNAACRYALGLPGGVLAALALWRVSQSKPASRAADCGWRPVRYWLMG